MFFDNLYPEEKVIHTFLGPDHANYRYQVSMIQDVFDLYHSWLRKHDRFTTSQYCHVYSTICQFRNKSYVLTDISKSTDNLRTRCDTTDKINVHLKDDGRMISLV